MLVFNQPKIAGRDYWRVPYFAGDVASLRSVINGAATSCKRFAIIGDSQETDTSSGVALIPWLNAGAFDRFGAASETPLLDANQYGNKFGAVGLAAGFDVPALDTLSASQMPTYQWGVTTGTSNGLLHSLSVRAQGSAAQRAGVTYFDDQSGTVIYEGYYRKSTTGPANVQLVETSNTATNYNATPSVYHRSSGLALNADNTSFVKYSSAPLVYRGPANPLWCVYSQGWNGSAAVSGLVQTAGKFRDTSKNKGVTFSSFSQGGQTITNFLSTRNNAGAWFKHVGPWDCVFITLFANDYPNPSAGFKTQMQTMIDTLRSPAWLDNPNQLICIVSDGPINGDLIGGTANAQIAANYDKHAAAIIQLTKENQRVAFLNCGRGARDTGESLSTTWLTDHVHLTPAGQAGLAGIWWKLIDAIR